MKKLKIFRTTKRLKNSREVVEFFLSKKATDGIIPYKGGWAIVKNRRVKEIYVGEDALKNAKDKN